MVGSHIVALMIVRHGLSYEISTMIKIKKINTIHDQNEKGLYHHSFWVIAKRSENVKIGGTQLKC